jgi:hypothetical protein
LFCSCLVTELCSQKIISSPLSFRKRIKVGKVLCWTYSAFRNHIHICCYSELNILK